MSHGLYPATLGSLGLASSLRQLLRHCRASAKAGVLRSPRAMQGARFEDRVEIALFRIAQEAVNNAIRHSRAKRVDLRLSYRQGRLVLRVTDDGVGFVPGTGGGEGLGITSMRERAKAIGAELDLTSRRGRTRVEVRVAARPVSQRTARRAGPIGGPKATEART
jgi:signal transduction histidine kinase